MTASQGWTLLKKTHNEWSEDNALRMAAALACYTILSLAPLIVITLKILSLPFILGGNRAATLVEGQLTQLIGLQSAQAIGDMIQAAAKPGSGILATIFSLLIVMFSASGVFAELQDSLNTVWEVKPRPDLSWWQTFKKRFTSIGMVFVIIFLLLVSMFVTSLLGGVIDSFFGESGSEAQKSVIATIVGYVVDFIVTVGVVGLLFTLMFKYLPDVKLRFGDVWLGGLVTAVLFKIGQYLLALYFYFGSSTSAYGAAGSLVAVLLWAYYSSAIFLLGAEFTRVYVQTFGARVEPDKDAVPITDEERAQHGAPRKEDLEDSADAVASGVAHRGGRVREPVRPPRVVTITQPAPANTKLAALGGLGVAAGLVIGAIGMMKGRRYRADSLAQIHLNERLARLESRLGHGKQMACAATAIRVNERVNAMDARLRKATHSLRRQTHPNLLDRVASYLRN